jgi:hypothetical protein
LASELIGEYATGRLAAKSDVLFSSVQANWNAAVDPATIDEFADSGIDGPDDVARIFSEQLFFGCEADDPLNAVAFGREFLPLDAQLNAFLGSDIGHWDVPDQRRVLPEAWELVEHGCMSRKDFRDFAFRNVTRMMCDVNPSFFEKTSVEPILHV